MFRCSPRKTTKISRPFQPPKNLENKINHKSSLYRSQSQNHRTAIHTKKKLSTKTLTTEPSLQKRQTSSSSSTAAYISPSGNQASPHQPTQTRRKTSACVGPRHGVACRRRRRRGGYFRAAVQLSLSAGKPPRRSPSRSEREVNFWREYIYM